METERETAVTWCQLEGRAHWQPTEAQPVSPNNKKSTWEENPGNLSEDSWKERGLYSERKG